MDGAEKTPEPAEPEPPLNPDAPLDKRALALAAMWFVIAALATAGGMTASIVLTSVWPRVIIDLTLVVVGTVSLMLASANVERWLGPRGAGWGRRLQWFTTSLIALTVVVILGAPASLLFPERTATFWREVAVDAGLVLVAGLITGAVILATGEGLARVIGAAQRRRRRTDDWTPKEFSIRHVLLRLLRGLALVAAGLLLSAIYTALTGRAAGTADTPGPRPSVWVDVIPPLILWFLGTAAVWWAFSRAFSQRHDDPYKPHSSLLHGTHATALGICLVIFMGTIAAGFVESHARSELWGRDPAGPTPVHVTGQQASVLSPYLAEQFEPHLRLQRQENWDPTTVTWYLKAATQETGSQFCKTKKGCYSLPASEQNQACDTPAGSCAPRGGGPDGALYYRYINASNDSGDQLPAANIDWTVIQYWVFYNFDSLQTATLSQWHQSDWEQVSVLVRKQGNWVHAVEVAFSEHCYGAVLPARLVQWDGSHPISYVGRGSHANYPRPVSVPIRQLHCSLAVAPKYRGVAGLFFSPALDGSRLEVPVTYLAGIRDRTSRRYPTPPLKLFPLDTVPTVVANWGPDNNLKVGAVQTAGSAGPQAPQVQGPSMTPFKSMLCNGDWLKAPGTMHWVCG